MGVFSDMSIDIAAGDAIPFASAQNPDNQEEKILATEPFDDEAVQQSEAEAAPAVLAALNEASEEIVPEEEDNPDPEVKKETAAEKAAAEEKRRKEHEESEAKRKAEWEAKQQVKAEEEFIAWEEILAKADGDAETAAMKKIGADAERLTRRNMKMCVSEHIQTKCLEDPTFARQAMHPRKSLINCFKYINRHAREFLEQEMKDNDETPAREGYGGDVPDDLCYKWAEDYFLDMKAEEDLGKEEKFIEKPYRPGYTPPKPRAKKKEPAKSKPKPEPKKQTEPEPNLFTQMLLGETA